jgi:hypothetical protein
MDGGALAVGLTVAGAVIALAGVGFFVGRVAEEVAAGAAVAGGLALVAVAWLASPDPAPAPDPAPEAPLVLAPASGEAPPVSGVPPPLPGREAARIAVEAAEAEPNDTLAGANLAPLGASIEGRLGQGDRDWFALDVPREARGTLVATVVTEDASVTMTLFDDAGQALGIARTIDEIRVRTATLERRLAPPRYHLLLMPASDVPARYQLTLAVRRW